MESVTTERAPYLAHARSLFLRGHYNAAIDELLALPEDLPQSLALVRAYLRVGNYTAALRQSDLARTAGLLFSQPAALCMAAMEIFARACSGGAFDAVQATHLSNSAKAFGSEVSNDVNFHVASALFIAGRHAEAERIVVHNRQINEPVGNELFIGRFELLNGLLQGAKGCYSEQLCSLSRALSRFLTSPERDVGLCALAAQGLCVLARDIHATDALNLIDEAENILEWPPDLSLQRFQIVRLLGWTKAMHGDYIAAIRRFAASMRIATGGLSMFVAHLDQAWAATISKQRIMADAALCDAAEYLDEALPAPLGEEAAAFTLAAELFTRRDLCLAQKALERARHSSKTLPKNAAYAHDERLQAMIDYADAVIREKRGERRVATLRAKRAYEVFSPIGYVWRAGKCAMLLYRLTGEPSWLGAAEDAAKAYPRSFLAADLARWQEAGRAPQERLTARQREIFEMLRRGLTFVQIGEALGCSPNTVRVHTGRIYEAFGVPKNAGLQGLFRALTNSAA